VTGWYRLTIWEFIYRSWEKSQNTCQINWSFDYDVRYYLVVVEGLQWTDPPFEKR
jgi:hypothetical protein